MEGWRLALVALLGLGLVPLFLPAHPQVKVGGPVDTGDTAWVLASTALVLLMAPGLSFFYGGMVRANRLRPRGPRAAVPERPRRLDYGSPPSRVAEVLSRL